MSEETPPDQAPGAPHPREAAALFGQDAAEQAFLAAHARDRPHHAWLLTGPEGIGKATLAWRIARFLLATPPAVDDGLFGAAPPARSLDIAPDHPVARRMAAGSEPGLAIVIRSIDDKKKQLRTQIVVDDIRRLGRFFGLSAADGGHRVVILDAADEMNTNAANALLKMLEEPPARTTLLLVCHRPSALLPTIRSRCRTLRLSPLGAADMAAALAQAGVEVPRGGADALAALAAGSIGAALRLVALDGLKLYGDLLAILSSLPRLDRPRALALAESMTGREGSARFDLALGLIETLLARLARTGASGAPPVTEAAPGEAALLTRLAPGPAEARAWADLAAAVSARATWASGEP